MIDIGLVVPASVTASSGEEQLIDVPGDYVAAVLKQF